MAALKHIRTVLRILWNVLAGFVLLLIVSALLIQTPIVKHWIKGYVEDRVTSGLQGTLKLGDIHGNFLTHIRIDSVELSYDGRQVISTGPVELRYNLLPLLNNTISVSELSVRSPRVTFDRPPEGGWNIGHLFSPSGDTTEASPFPFTIDLRHLSIDAGTVSVTDSLSLLSPNHESIPGTLEYHRFRVDDIRLDAGVKFNDGHAQLDMKHLSGRMNGSEFVLDSLAGRFIVTPESARAGNVSIRTANSSIHLDADMKGINLFGHIDLEEMRTNPTRLHLKAGAVDFAELAWFLPPVDFLHGSSSADIDVDGEFGDLAIHRLELATYRSHLSISGRLKNLDRPSRLMINATIAPSNVFPPDASRLLPPFGIPKFEGLGVTTISGEFNGLPLNFRSKVRIEGTFGSIATVGGLNLEQDIPAYDGTFAVAGLNLNPVLQTEDFPSRLFAHGDLAGSGFDLDSIMSHANIALDSGTVRNLDLSPSTVYLVASPRHVETVSSLTVDGMILNIRGSYDTRDRRRPAFESDLQLTSVDLATLFDRPKLATDLTLRGRVSGTGTSLDDLNLHATLTLLPSVIFSHAFGEDEVLFNLEQRDAQDKELTLKSSVADVEVHGAFNLRQLGLPLVDQCLSVYTKVVEHTQRTDTSGAGYTIARRSRLSNDHDDFTYALRVKDLQAVSTLIEGTPFNAEGTLAGRVKRSGSQIVMDGHGTFENFFIGNIRGGILLRNTAVGFNITNDAGTSRLERINADVTVDIGSITSSVMSIDSIAGSLHIDNERGTFTASGFLDSLYAIGCRGVASIQPQTYVFDIDSLGIAAHGDVWKNREDVQLRLNRHGLRIMRAELSSDSASILIEGGMNESGTFDLRSTLHEVGLEHVAAFTRDTLTFRPATGLRGKVDAEISLSGTPDAPVMDIRASGHQFAFRENPIGALRASASYRDKRGSFNLQTEADPNDTSVTVHVDGVLPIDLSFSRVERRFLPEPQRIQISANRFDVGMFQPLVPDLRELRGLMSCNIVIGGTPGEPEYSGSISIPEARFTFSANNIAYVGSGEMTPRGQKILLNDFLLKNVPPDNPRGTLHVNGFIAVRDYTIDDFDLRATGDLLFMSPASRRTMPLLYGTLFAATDTTALRIRGTLDHPIVSGGLLVRYADLVLPPKGAMTSGGSYNSLQYSTIDDTTLVAAPSRSLSSAFYAVIDSILLDKSHRRSAPDIRFVDRLRYDLTVETDGQTQIKMVITPSTKEELYAELQGKVNILNQTGEHNIYGEVSVVRPSYYNFLKQFDAIGTLRFAGPWDNPRLNIRAMYEGSRTAAAASGTEADPSLTTAPQKVLVLLDITGTRYEPGLSMSIKLISAAGDTIDRGTQAVGELQSDAISFILTGKFRDDLNTQDRQGIYSNLEQTATSSVLAGVSSSLSTYLTDFVRQELPFIRRAEVLYGGGSFEEGTSVSLAGQIGYGTWRVAGRVFNKIGSANINYQMSLGEILEKRFLRNLFLELERKVEGSDNTGDEKTTNSARVYYRISF